jgi:two-component system OmpR family response regulator
MKESWCKMSNSNQDFRILLVDDEPTITEFLEMGLQNEGFHTKAAHHGIEAVKIAKEFQPHIVILDVMMPGLDGFEICSMLKKLDFASSIIMLTAKEDVDDRVKGLTLGADDYMAKPFSFKELLARIQARLRNQFPHAMQDIIKGPFRLSDNRKEIKFHNRVLELSLTEYHLLTYLVINQGLVLSKSMILDKVWGYDFFGDDNIVEVYIRSLREKLGDHDRTIIRTLRGSGYRVDL